jgi:hypothetical protein
MLQISDDPPKLNCSADQPRKAQSVKQWPSSALGNWMQNGSAELLWHGPCSLPMTTSVQPRQACACYITSLRSAWFDYAAEEIADKPRAAWSFRCAGQIARLLGLDKIVLVGNAPISTNVWTRDYISEIPNSCRQAAAVYSDCFIGVRNLQKGKHALLMAQLEEQGFYAIPARIVYEFDFRQNALQERSHLNRDRAALKRSGLQVNLLTMISEEEAVHFRNLYQAIYIDKHSALNAQYTPQFFTDMVSSGVMTALVLQNKDNRVIAFAMLYAVDDTLTVPALGYDPQSPINGLYRQLFAAISLYAQDKRMLLNYSSGAGDFKRKRGGVAHLEYTLLKAPRKWRFLKSSILAIAERYGRRIRESDMIAWGA